MLVHRGLLAMALVCAAAPAMARDQMIIVGSSTVFPFTNLVIERFARTTGFPAPFSEATGTGGGIDRFCAGPGFDTPDLTGASRPIRAEEIAQCQENRVFEITELPIGRDGIVLAGGGTSVEMALSLAQVFMATAKLVPGPDGELIDNPYKNWSDIDPSLPNEKIEVLGPPPTSGTRDAFAEIAMEGGCKTFPGIAALKKSDSKKYKAVCRGVREDGAYIEAGENDNLIVQKLEVNPSALGIFGFSFLDQNGDKLQGSVIGGVEPTFEDIASGNYPVARSLYFYVKNAHVGTIPGIEDYLAAFTDEKAWGEFGYLSDKGLIPLPEAERAASGAAVRALTPLSM